MTRANLVDHIAEKTGLTKAARGKVLRAFLDFIQEGLVSESMSTISGFGTFVVDTREKRNGRNHCHSRLQGCEIPSRQKT